MLLDGGKINLALARAAKSPIELARDAKISESTLTRIRNGQNARQKTAGKIARALGVDVTELLKD